jgi:hypothetical protein
MSMSTHVIGFRPADEKWKKMKAVWDTCKQAGIEPPDEVDDFFGGSPPDDAGVEVDLEDYECCSNWNDNISREGFEINLDKLPKGIKIIRFYNSY